jgi:hypothetical protein
MAQCPVFTQCKFPTRCTLVRCEGWPMASNAYVDPNKICTYCGQTGHNANNCPTARKEREERDRRSHP